MLGNSIYSYIWRTSRKGQLQICVLVGLVASLSVLPLELQRRIVDNAVTRHELWLLAVLGLAYLLVLLIQGSLKYSLNLVKGRVLEEVSRDLRKRILKRKWEAQRSASPAGDSSTDSGTTLSILTAESESIGEFASMSLATPLLQSATIAWVMGYLIWVEPQIAALAILIYAPQIFLVPKIQRNINRFSRRRTRIMRKLGREAVAFETIVDGEHASPIIRTSLFVNMIFRIRMIIYRQKYILTFLGNFLNSLGTLVVLLVGGYMVIEGQTSVSTLVVFISGFQKISEPWDELINFYRSVSTARVNYGMVAETLDGTSTHSKKGPLVDSNVRY
jgi:ABC-type bacteriocin/lantibiotic exporter with double-glycine peptidase domain